MTDKLTGNAPYYRTVPSSPEPDDDEIFLPGDDEEMSPALPKSGKKAEAKTGKPEEEDEETILRRRLLEKKREKEREELLLKKKQQQQKVEVREVRTQQQPSSSSALPKKREPIVWDKEKVERREQRGTTTTTVTTTAGTARSSKTAAESSRTVVKKRGVGQQRGKEVGQKLEKTSTTSSTSNQPKQRGVVVQQARHGRDEQQQHRSKHSSSSNRAKPGSSTSSSSDRHRHRVVEEAEGKNLGRVEREQKNAKKRPREASKSPERRRERRKAPIEGGEGQKKEVPKPEEQHEMAPMEEISPVEEEKPLPMVMMDTVEEVHDDVPSPSAKKPKKYSKFDTPSPEGSDEEGKGAEAGPAGRKHRIGEIYYSEDEQSDFGMDEAEKAEEGEADEEEEMQVDSDLPENKEFEQLTEQEKAMLTPEKLKQLEQRYQKRLISQLPVYYPGISGCRSVVEYECLNKISEGTFGVVYRAQERRTDEIVALKRLKMEKEHQGFPITSLREINMLLKCGNHPNVLNVREVVVGSSMDKIYMVMEYVEHDMKSLMELMKSRSKKFTIPQVKTLLRQLLSGVEHMHEEYVIHRDLKTSNLLLSHQGILKIGDFGLAREFGEPIKPYTPVVVTLWYRSPELLLSTKVYSTPVDLWSVGCIFGEFLKLDPLFPGRTEVEQLQKIFKEVGTPNEQIWPGCMQLPGMRSGIFADTPYNQLRRKFASELPDDDGYELMNKLLALDPSKRLSATEALKSRWFQNDPKPTPPSSFPTWPAKSEHNKKPPNEPTAPPRKPVGGFTLKFDVPKF